MEIIDNGDGTLTKIYDLDEVKRGIMKDDMQKMEDTGYRTIAGEPVEKIQVVLLGYKRTFKKKGTIPNG